jgi:hypothetical protein
MIVMLLTVLFGASGCGHVSATSTHPVGAIESFGCGGDVPSPYAPYCRPKH